MNPERLPSLTLLTRRERECLSLVALGMRSKEIAPLLGIEPSSVDAYLKSAGRRTAMSDRRALARLFVQHQPESYQSTLQRLGYVQNPLGLVPFAEPDRSAEQIDGPDQPSSWWWPVPTAERQWNTLSALQKRIWAVVVALGALALGGTLLFVARHALEQAAFL